MPSEAPLPSSDPQRPRTAAAVLRVGERFVFGSFELAPHAARLERAGVRVSLSPKPYAVLLHLIRERERVVPKAELLEVAWPGVRVSDAALWSVIRDLRRVLGDAAQGSRYVETLRGHGLRFVHPVEVLAAAPGEAEALSTWEAAAARIARALPALEALHDLRGERRPELGVGSRDQSELLLALGRAHWAAGATAASRGTFLRLARAARAAGDSELFGWAALGFAGRTDLAPGVQSEAVELLEEALVRLPERPTALRAELLARLGTELYFSAEPERSDRLTREAVAQAEAVGEKSVLAYAWTARQFALYRPDLPPERRLPLSQRVLDLLEGEPPSDVLALGLQERIVDLLEMGEGAAFRETLRRFAGVAEALRQPFFLWTRSLFEGLCALLEGDVEGAERRAYETFDLGRRVGTPNAFPVQVAQIFAVRHEQGRLGELASPVETLLADRPGAPLFLAALAAARAASGEIAKARRALGQLVARGLADAPRDLHWLSTLGLAASAAVAIGDPDLASRVALRLEPYRGRIVPIGYGAAIHGAVDHHLGVLAAVRGRPRGGRGAPPSRRGASRTRRGAALGREEPLRPRGPGPGVRRPLRSWEVAGKRPSGPSSPLPRGPRRVALE